MAVPPIRRPVGAFVRRMSSALLAPDPSPLAATGRHAHLVVERIRAGISPQVAGALASEDPDSQVVRVYRLGRATMALELARQSLRTRPDAPFMIAIADAFSQIVLDALGTDEATSRAIADALELAEEDLQSALDAMVDSGVLTLREDAGDLLYAATPEALAHRIPLDAVADDEPL